MCQISQEWTGTQMSSLGGNRSSGFTKCEPPGGFKKIGRTKKFIYFYLFVQNRTTLNCHNGWIFRYLIVARMTPSLSVSPNGLRTSLSSYSASKACKFLTRNSPKQWSENSRSTKARKHEAA